MLTLTICLTIKSGKGNLAISNFVLVDANATEAEYFIPGGGSPGNYSNITVVFP